MGDTLTRVLVRRERILSRVAQQRDGVALAFAPLQRPVAVVDRLIEAGRALRARPGLVVILLAALFAWRARTVIGVVARGITLWKTLRSLRALVGRLAG